MIYKYRRRLLITSAFYSLAAFLYIFHCLNKYVHVTCSSAICIERIAVEIRIRKKREEDKGKKQLMKKRNRSHNLMYLMDALHALISLTSFCCCRCCCRFFFSSIFIFRIHQIIFCFVHGCATSNKHDITYKITLDDVTDAKSFSY